MSTKCKNVILLRYKNASASLLWVFTPNIRLRVSSGIDDSGDGEIHFCLFEAYCVGVCGYRYVDILGIMPAEVFSCYLSCSCLLELFHSQCNLSNKIHGHAQTGIENAHSGTKKAHPAITTVSASAIDCNDGTCPSGLKCVLDHCVTDVECPKWQRFGKGPPQEDTCTKPSDPNHKKPAPLEKWFTKEMFLDLFPKANLGWGPNACWPYSYEAFVIAARYFPKFGTESPKNQFSEEDNVRRDLAAFFSHSIQETGENDASLYATFADNRDMADACFYRGGFFNWFEGGPVSAFLPKETPGYAPKDGDKCNAAGRYCVAGSPYKCNTEKVGEKFYKGCYFGRGSIQLSYNFNYGQFQEWLHSQNLKVDLLNEPNLLMTKMDPPLAIMASLWFYMTPQPPKPAMHDIVLGKFEFRAKK